VGRGMPGIVITQPRAAIVFSEVLEVSAGARFGLMVSSQTPRTCGTPFQHIGVAIQCLVDRDASPRPSKFHFTFLVFDLHGQRQAFGVRGVKSTKSLRAGISFLRWQTLAPAPLPKRFARTAPRATPTSLPVGIVRADG
jgi:hypothetical protein